ncbi:MULTISPECIES: MBL fold metallo-hydrolase [unclassified Frankia]|uniref:MBL fold metallo-hydrolase n=1 Tax=unclassified Frankia TaxID=2632575 RepID=UPI002023C29A
MHLTVLGCRSGMPSGGQGSSGYLVSTDSTRILLDCGPGVALALSMIGHPKMLDAVVISHFHLDHCYDLLPVGKTLLSRHARYGASFPTLPEILEAAGTTRLTPIPLYVPAGGRATLRKLAELFPVATIPLLDRAFDLAFDVREYVPGESFTVGDCTISMHALRHAIPNCGVRLDSPAGSLAYTGDTGWTDALIPLARDVDLLLAEATLEIADNGPHGHLCATDAGTAAAEADAGQLVLTHFISADPRWLAARQADARQVFTGPVHIAAPAAQFDTWIPGGFPG